MFKFVHFQNRPASCILILFLICLSIGEVSHAAEAELRSLVFDKGLTGSEFFRIPGIASMPDGSVIAVADRRWDSSKDLPGRIDVVARRSDDGGRTWGDVIVIAEADEGGGYGDPAIAFHPQSGNLICVMTHGEGLWEADESRHADIMVCRSSDGGKTWTKPQKITLENKIPDYISGFASSGAMTVTKDGKIMFVLVVRNNLKKWSSLLDFAVWSDDAGKTWDVAPMPADTDGDEAKIAELRDGSLLMSIRNRRKGERKFSNSTDGGKTWSEPWQCTGMVEPACNGDIAPLGNVLLHTVPADSSKRRNVTLFRSEDNGHTWQPVYLICPAPSGYSSLTVLDDSHVGILSEENASDGGWRIWFTRLNLKEE